jgi:hypothetical protein
VHSATTHSWVRTIEVKAGGGAPQLSGRSWRTQSVPGLERVWRDARVAQGGDTIKARCPSACGPGSNGLPARVSSCPDGTV